MWFKPCSKYLELLIPNIPFIWLFSGYWLTAHSSYLILFSCLVLASSLLATTLAFVTTALSLWEKFSLVHRVTSFMASQSLDPSLFKQGGTRTKGELYKALKPVPMRSLSNLYVIAHKRSFTLWFNSSVRKKFISSQGFFTYIRNVVDSGSMFSCWVHTKKQTRNKK